MSAIFFGLLLLANLLPRTFKFTQSGHAVTLTTGKYKPDSQPSLPPGSTLRIPARVIGSVKTNSESLRDCLDVLHKSVATVICAWVAALG